MLLNIEEGLYKTFTLDHLTEVEALIKNLEFHRKTNQPMELLSRIQQNIVKKLEIPYRKVYGEWNGYGYTILGRVIDLRNEEISIREIIKLLKKFRKFYSVKVKHSRKKLTHEEKVKTWVNRLVKLINTFNENNSDSLSFEDAFAIAEEKIKYKEEKINELVERQCQQYSFRREKLINQLSRRNPLRRIKDIHHARAILTAHDRHTNTNYDSLLKDARVLAICGEIEFNQIKDYAFSNMS